MDVDALLSELTPSVERLVDRHIETAKAWYPHEYVPWSRGRDFEDDGSWDPQEHPLSDAVRSALYVNLLTEDNLPYYLRTIDRMFATAGEPWAEWNHRWTAEEGRHADAIRAYVHVTRAIDPWALERGRMAQMSSAMVPEPHDGVDGMVYVTLQELATRLAHRNTGKLMEDRVGYDLLARVAADENYHFLFYRDLTSDALAIAPELVLPAIERQVSDFEMPGTGIPGFKEHASAIAQARIYDFLLHHDLVLQPVIVRHWNLPGLEGLPPEADAARERILATIERIGRVGRKLEEKRRKREASALERGVPSLA